MRYPGTSGLFILMFITALVGTGECRGATIIGHWDFEEGGGIIAHSPHGLDGVIVNATYVNVNDTTRPALGTYALAFNGSNTYVEVGNNALLAPATIAISLWFKCDGQSDIFDILDKGHGMGSNPYYGGYVLQGLNDQLGAMYGNGSGFPGISVYGLYNGMWHHVVANLGQDAIELYVDMIPVPGGGPGAGAIAQNDSDLFFGRHRALGRYYNGLIADIQLYDGALSQQDVIALYYAPEPATLSLLALGGLGVLFRKRK